MINLILSLTMAAVCAMCFVSWKCGLTDAQGAIVFALIAAWFLSAWGLCELAEKNGGDK